MTDEQIIQRAIVTAKELTAEARNQLYRYGRDRKMLANEMRAGARAIEALLGLLRQKEAAHGAANTEGGKSE